MKNIAVILTGGSGSRFGLNMPKQFAKLAGKTIIEHTIEIFQKHELIDEICLVSNKDWTYKLEEIVRKNYFNKVSKIINGGSQRYESSLNALESYRELMNKNEDVNIIFHDGVRPLLNPSIITECIKELEDYKAIDVAIPAADTIIEVENSIISNIPNRDRLNRGQTPQAFKLDTIIKAYEIGMKDSNFKVTDDCGVVKKYLPEIDIKVVKGSNQNIKITYIEDLYIAEKLFQLKSIQITKKLDEQYYNNLKDKVLVIFGGSYGIGKDIAKLAKDYNAKVYTFSRSETNTDVANINDVKEALESVYKKEGKIDYVINSAAILIKKSLYNMDYTDILNSININYTGAVTIIKESIKYLKESNGSILNFTSSSYSRGRADYSIYSSSKAAIVNLTQAMAEELECEGIRVNCINPERTLTPMRIKNFGKEDSNTLLSSKDVALISINTILSDITGQIVDIKVQN